MGECAGRRGAGARRAGNGMQVSLTAVIAVGVCGAILVLALWALAAARRVRSNEVTASEVVGARQGPMSVERAPEENRARVDEYLEREQAELDQRRMTLETAEDRIAQREQTLEQRASNLALREQMAVRRESEVADLRTEAERLGQDARTRLERISLLDADAAKE